MTPYRPHTPEAARMATESAVIRARDRIRHVDRFHTDPEQTARIDASTCRHCYYLLHDQWGGAMMVEWACGLCGTPAKHSTTTTPRLCLDCAREHHLCVRCGGDCSMREDREHWPTPTVGNDE